MIVSRATNAVFNPLRDFWLSERVHSRVTAALVPIFLLAMLGIELNRLGLMPEPLAQLTPTNHFHAVGLAFTLVLVLEVVGLIFVLPESISKSVGKQFEILALILLRNSFKELVHFPEPVQVQGQVEAILRIASDGVGALVLLVLLGLYSRAQRKRPSMLSDRDKERYVAAKKLVALALLALFTGMGAWRGWLWFSGRDPFDFFAAFYTVLIFSDVLLVLISQQFLPAFHAVLRNSGYALSTLLLRLALTAPPYYNAVIGVGAALFALCLTYAYNHLYAPALPDE